MYMIEIFEDDTWSPIAFDTPEGLQYHFDNIATAFRLAEHSPKCEKFRIIEINIVAIHPVPPEWVTSDPLRRRYRWE